MESDPQTLSGLLTELPIATPLFLPDELLAIWFAPWSYGDGVNPASLEAAKTYGERFNCTFSHDGNMGQWCYIKSSANSDFSPAPSN